MIIINVENIFVEYVLWKTYYYVFIVFYYLMNKNIFLHVYCYQLLELLECFMLYVMLFSSCINYCF